MSPAITDISTDVLKNDNGNEIKNVIENKIDNDKKFKKVEFNLDSPIFIELQRILNNSPLNDKTQKKIEEFLLNQATIIFNDRISESKDINYYKLNSSIIKRIRSSYSDLDKLINNFRENVTQKKIKKFDLELNYLFSVLTNDLIIKYLLGRVLRIISNNSLINKNTISVNVAIDLAKDLVNYCIIFEYNKFKKKKYIP